MLLTQVEGMIQLCNCVVDIQRVQGHLLHLCSDSEPIVQSQSHGAVRCLRLAVCVRTLKVRFVHSVECEQSVNNDPFFAQ